MGMRMLGRHILWLLLLSKYLIIAKKGVFSWQSQLSSSKRGQAALCHHMSVLVCTLLPMVHAPKHVTDQTQSQEVEK